MKLGDLSDNLEKKQSEINNVYSSGAVESYDDAYPFCICSIICLSGLQRLCLWWIEMIANASHDIVHINMVPAPFQFPMDVIMQSPCQMMPRQEKILMALYKDAMKLPGPQKHVWGFWMSGVPWVSSLKKTHLKKVYVYIYIWLWLQM